MKRHDEARVRCCCFYHGQSSEPRCVPVRVPDPDDACDTGLFAGSFLRGLGAILAASVRGCRQTVCDRRTRSAKACVEMVLHQGAQRLPFTVQHGKQESGTERIWISTKHRQRKLRRMQMAEDTSWNMCVYQ